MKLKFNVEAVSKATAGIAELNEQLDRLNAEFDRCAAAINLASTFTAATADLERRRADILGAAFLAGKEADTKAIDAEIAAEHVKAQRIERDATAANAAVGLLNERRKALLTQRAGLLVERRHAAVAALEGAFPSVKAELERATEAYRAAIGLAAELWKEWQEITYALGQSRKDDTATELLEMHRSLHYDRATPSTQLQEALAAAGFTRDAVRDAPRAAAIPALAPQSFIANPTPGVSITTIANPEPEPHAVTIHHGAPPPAPADAAVITVGQHQPVVDAFVH